MEKLTNVELNDFAVQKRRVTRLVIGATHRKHFLVKPPFQNIVKVRTFMRFRKLVKTSLKILQQDKTKPRCQPNFRHFNLDSL